MSKLFDDVQYEKIRLKVFQSNLKRGIKNLSQRGNNISIKDISIKKAYSSDSDNILQDFYLPALENSVEYLRLAGFFSSTALAISARGIYGLIKNAGNMKLIVCPKLSRSDVEVIKKVDLVPQEFISKSMFKEFEQFEHDCIRDHVYILGWMIANKKLEIKVALIHDEEKNLLDWEETEQSGIFHQKVGILKDAKGDIISFSGSINESAKGWLENIEEFKVFRYWKTGEKEYVEEDIRKFNNFWNNKSKRLKTLKIPTAVEKHLIEISPTDISKLNLNKWYKKIKSDKKKITLYEYQEDALRSWLRNDQKGIFEMATGTGKTFTALACLSEVINSTHKFAAVIACPYNHLLQQWKREIDKFGIEYEEIITADSTNPLWKKKLADVLIDIDLGYRNRIIILTTHSTFGSDSFVSIIKKYSNKTHLFLICDEVHGIGSEKRRKGLIDDYKYRLGLSATPRRWFDDIGTEEIYKYFNDVIFEFELKKAIYTEKPNTGGSYLTPYRYIPKFISLLPDELEKYIRITKAIIMNLDKAKTNEDKDTLLQNLLFKRADIIKNATNKYSVLEKILDEIHQSIYWTIIYCSPQQIDSIMDIINDRKLIAHRFTMEEGVIPKKEFQGLSQRDDILIKFTEKKFQILVAMKCLDEGVDVPPARTAIILASSGNPREYIQRIGRVIRRHKGKKEAIIYDVIVVPSFDELPPDLREIEWNIFKKELARYNEIAKIALNSVEAISLIFEVKKKYFRGGK